MTARNIRKTTYSVPIGTSRHLSEDGRRNAFLVGTDNGGVNRRPWTARQHPGRLNSADEILLVAQLGQVEVT